MSKINRENLMTNLNGIKEQKEELKKKEFVYRIQRNWPGVGKIQEIDSAPELVRAWTVIHRDNETNKEAISALNMADGTFEEFMPKDNKHYGFTMEEWENEMKMKRDELAVEAKIEKIDKAISILEKNMSEDDKFNSEMAMVDELLD